MSPVAPGLRAGRWVIEGCPPQRAGAAVWHLTFGEHHSILRHMTNYRNRALDDVIAITKALADEQRVRALMALRHGELCACQVAELLGLAASTVSKHLSILKQARLVEVRKDGRWAYYRQSCEAHSAEARRALDWLQASLANALQIRDDARRLREITRIDRETLCRGYKRD